MNQRTRLTLQFVIGRGNDGKDLMATKSFQNIDGKPVMQQLQPLPMR